VELEKGVPPTAALTEELLALGREEPTTAGIRTVRYHPGFPVDIRHNSKIDRPALGVWASS